MECKSCVLPVHDNIYCDEVKQITVNSKSICIDFINEENLSTFRSFTLADEYVFVFGNDLLVHQKDGKTQVIAKIDSKLQKIWGDELENL